MKRSVALEKEARLRRGNSIAIRPRSNADEALEKKRSSADASPFECRKDFVHGLPSPPLQFAMAPTCQDPPEAAGQFNLRKTYVFISM